MSDFISTLENLLSESIPIYYEKETGMLITADPTWYKVFFRINQEDKFEYVSSFLVDEVSESQEFIDIILGARILAKQINENEVSL